MFCQKDVWRDVTEFLPTCGIVSPWTYGMIRDGYPLERQNEQIRDMMALDSMGYEIVPACSTWNWHLNAKDMMLFCRKNSSEHALAGFMMAPRMLTIEKKYYAHLNAAYTFYHARNDIFGI